MNFSKLNTDVLRQALKLSERKEVLLQELEKIENEILSHLNGHTTSPATATKKAQASKKNGVVKRLDRGVMKQNILQALTEAGPAGLRIPELSKKINATSASIHVWFTNIGKKLAEIEKVGAGHFRMRQ